MSRLYSIVYAGRIALMVAIIGTITLLWPGTALAGSDHDDDDCHYSHYVHRGDDLAEIAVHYGVDVYTLARENDIQNPNYLQKGQEICIPGYHGAYRQHSDDYDKHDKDCRDKCGHDEKWDDKDCRSKCGHGEKWDEDKDCRSKCGHDEKWDDKDCRDKCGHDEKWDDDKDCRSKCGHDEKWDEDKDCRSKCGHDEKWDDDKDCRSKCGHDEKWDDDHDDKHERDDDDYHHYSNRDDD